MTPVERIASEHIFSLLEWEAANFPKKWIRAVGYLIPGAKPSRDERLAIVDEYLEVVRRADKERRRVEGAAQLGGVGGSTAAAKSAAASDEYLRELLAEKRRLQPEAEEALEAEISAVLADFGFQSRVGLIWPPLDFRFTQPPTLLVISPRNEIRMVGGVFLDPEIEPFDRDAVEKRVVEELGYSAYVDDLAGLATFPNMVNDLYTARTIARTAAHEWLHAYWFFHPFGRNYFASDEMTTLNETAATLAGNELGDIAFARIGGDLSENARRYAAESQANPDFTAFMRETRLEAERLLSDGMVDEAEDYMRKPPVGAAPARILYSQAESGVLRLPWALRRQPGVRQPRRRADARAALIRGGRRRVHQHGVGSLDAGGVRGATGAAWAGWGRLTDSHPKSSTNSNQRIPSPFMGLQGYVSNFDFLGRSEAPMGRGVGETSQLSETKYK